MKSDGETVFESDLLVIKWMIFLIISDVFSKLRKNGTKLNKKGNFRMFCFSYVFIYHALASCYWSIIVYLICLTASLYLPY